MSRNGRWIFAIYGIVSLSLASLSLAKDFGIQGAVFEIREESLLELIQKRLRKISSQKLLEHQEAIQKRVTHTIENPLPVEGLRKAESNAARFYDPSLIVDEDIKDHKGNLIVRKGTHVNPLDHRSFGKPLLLIQGDDDRQVQWALKQEGKIVLVSGKPLALAKTYGVPFYFDQGAILSNKFSITAVPVRVSQKDRMLLVEEVSLKGGPS